MISSFARMQKQVKNVQHMVHKGGETIHNVISLNQIQNYYITPVQKLASPSKRQLDIDMLPQ